MRAEAAPHQGSSCAPPTARESWEMEPIPQRGPCWQHVLGPALSLGKPRGVRSEMSSQGQVSIGK